MRSLLFFVLVFPLTASAQFGYTVDPSIPVSKGNGDPLSKAWAGGLNASQYSTMELNGDGAEDLVLFDRIANKVITYINQNNQYIYNSGYEMFFPDDVTNWILLRDYNGDGKKDLFTSDIFGIKVYTNTTSGSTPTWEHLPFYDGTGGKSEVILTLGFTQKINLQLQFDDLPSISDIDGDGDLDILSVRFPAGGTIEFHKNFSKERYGTLDSLDFERVTTTWGGFTECACGSFMFNNANCPDDGRIKHAGGKTLTALDVDGDNDQDLLFSEASCRTLYLLRNTGTNTDAQITSSVPFPLTNPVVNLPFPAAYYEDVDFDGVNDLLVSPNIFTNDFPASVSNMKESNYFYKNSGTNASPQFTFVQRNFLQDQMIETGDNAVPAFADYDADGDLDMFISQLTSPAFSASLALYKNVGTAQSPEFILETDDYLGFSGLNLYNVKFQWIDITADSKIDMVFTATDFQNGFTSLYYIPNKSSGAFDFGGADVVSTGFRIGRPENVYVTYINADGALDLLIGKSNGALQYWRNAGEPGSVNYVLEDDTYLGIAVSTLRQNLKASIGDLDANGEDDLVLGDQLGKPQIIPDFRTVIDNPVIITDIVYNPLDESYRAQNLGGRIWPEVVNLFNTNKPVIVIGNVMGGVQILRNDDDSPLAENPDVKIYPVPVSRLNENINIKIDRAAQVEIYTSLGQRINTPIILSANKWHAVSVASLSAGVYILRFTAGNRYTVKRIVVY